ncbi:MAG TPA: VCBS repeat-containing protein [Candidatus Acidoferrales bacterium]|nr:VCBS repeat-containing protein [Candidatus Acidoferrales bacterium]
MKTTIFILALGTAGAWVVTASLPASSPQDNFERVVVPVGKGPAPIAIADVNHDGHAEIFVGNSGDSTLSVLLNDGHRHFTPAPGSPFACGKNPNDIAVADMNGDGNPDVIIANTGTPYITILLGDGRGGFTPARHSPFATTSYPHVHGVAIGDFMGDGKPAVVTDSWGHSEILLIPSDGQGSLILPGKKFRADLYSDSGVRAADFNHDGHLDVVTVEQTFGTSGRPTGVGLLLGDGHGGFQRAPGSPFPAGGEPWEFTVDDINRDGNLDVVVSPYQRDLPDPSKLGVTVLLGDGKGGFTTMAGSPLSLAGCQGPDRVRSGNIFGDGLRDIVVSCAQNDKLFIFRQMKDGSFRTSILDVSTDWSGIEVGALDSSGKDAIVVSNNDRGTITIFFRK